MSVPTRHLSAAALGSVLLLAACGGGSSEGQKPPLPAAVAPQPRPTPAEEGPAAKAEARFAELEKQLEDLKDGKPIDATWLEAQLQGVLELDPKHSGARFNLAVLTEARGDKAAARKAFEQLVRDDPSFWPAAENVAADQVSRGNLEYAIKVYKGAIKADPKNVTSRLAYARILLTQKQYRDAIKLCRKVLQRQADAIEAFRILAESYRALGDTSMAELIIGRGLKVDKEDVQLHYLTAKILLARDDLSGGVDKLKQVVTMKPDWLKVRGELAEIFLTYQDFGNAAQQFEAILKEAPDDRASKIGLAVSYKGTGRHEQAEKLYKELLAKNQRDVETIWNLAVLYHRQLNRYDEAIALYKQYAKLANPGDKNAAKVDRIVATIEKQKKDLAALKARQERERKRAQAIEASCTAVAAGRKPHAEAIGSDQDRIQAAWDLMLVKAVGEVQAGDIETGSRTAECALAIVPTSAGDGATACSAMHLQWVKIQDELGLLADGASISKAIKTVQAALECDPENPEAQLIEQQLKEFLAQVEASDAAPEPGAADSGAPPSGS
jgi:tetratricopeptide (TPR) repeat protein